MLQPMRDYFQQIYVLEPVDGSKAIRYVCYMDLRTSQFCVSSGEVLTSPQDADALSWHAVNQAEYFIKEGVSRWFETLLEAVEDASPIMDDERPT